MKTNVLISKTELGKVKRTTFNHSSPDTTYGAAMPHDAEGAWQVISKWQEHVPNPHAKPGPDFRAMNKAAADSGLVSSTQIRTFREGHPATLKTGVESVTKAAPRLPSDKDPSFTYGKPATYRSAEEVRNFGLAEPPVKGLVQGAYSHAWVDMNLARQDEFDVRRKYIKPAPTAATEGHALGAQQTIAKHSSSGSGSPTGKSTAAGSSSWKMKKFESKAEPRVTQYITGQSNSRVERIH
ncbi:hypothetical protein OEZ86_008559 [Tetradesmus obliquus]|nr:hypothetical protein OEZ86_008559 [Tetradesmus obliquus]